MPSRKIILLCILVGIAGCAQPPAQNAARSVETPAAPSPDQAADTDDDDDDGGVKFVGVVKMRTFEPPLSEAERATDGGLKALLDKDVSAGFLTADERDEVLRQRETLNARRAEIEHEHPGKSIAMADGQVFTAADFTSAWNNAEREFPEAMIYVEGPPGFTLYSSMRGVPTLDAFLGREPSFGLKEDVSDGVARSLLDQRAEFERQRAQITREHPNEAVAVVDEKVFSGETASELTANIRATHPSRMIYYEDPPNHGWEILDTSWELGDRAIIPGSGAAAVFELSATTAGGRAMTRSWIAGVSTGSGLTYITRRILRNTKIQFHGVLVCRGESPTPRQILPFYSGIELKLRRADGATAIWNSPFVLSELEIVGMNVLYDTKTIWFPYSVGSPALADWPNEPPPPPPMPDPATLPIGPPDDLESAWHKVRMAFKDWAPPPGGNKLPVELRDALTKFLHFQDSEFRGRPEAFQLVRTRDADNVYLLCFEDSEHKDDEHSIAFGRSPHLQGSFQHLLLDTGGARLPAQWQFTSHDDGQEHHIEPARGQGYDLIRLKDALRGISASLEYSVDADGFVPEGDVDATEFQTPHRLNAEAVPFDRPAVEALLASSRPGDLFRALWQIDAASEHDEPPAGGATLGTELFEHADADVRARAIAVLGENRLESLAEFANDPSPRVRITALDLLYLHERETELARTLAQGADRDVALMACQYLCFNNDLEVARKGLLRLIAERDFRAIGDHHYDMATYRRYSELSSPEVAEALVSWLEADLENALRDRESGVGHAVEDLPSNLPRLRAEHLRPFASRLVALCERIAPADYLGLRRDLFVALIKTEDVAADGLVAPYFDQPNSISTGEMDPSSFVEDVWCSIFGVDAHVHGHPLFARSKPFAPAIPILQEIAAQPSATPNFDGDPTTALALLAKWSVPGAESALLKDLSTEPAESAQQTLARLIGEKLLPQDLIERLKAAARTAGWPEERIQTTFQEE